jgi:hypothetical protein
LSGLFSSIVFNYRHWHALAYHGRESSNGKALFIDSELGVHQQTDPQKLMFQYKKHASPNTEVQQPSVSEADMVTVSVYCRAR